LVHLAGVPDKLKVERLALPTVESRSRLIAAMIGLSIEAERNATKLEAHECVCEEFSTICSLGEFLRMSVP
jgi:hypothetical protein